MLQRSILCMQGTQYATKRSILCRGAFCGPTWLINNDDSELVSLPYDILLKQLCVV